MDIVIPIVICSITYINRNIYMMYGLAITFVAAGIGVLIISFSFI